MYQGKSESNRGIAQLVEHRSPKPGVVSSNLTAPANKKRSPLRWPFLLAFGEVDENSRESEFDAKREAGGSTPMRETNEREGTSIAKQCRGQSYCPCQSR